MSDIRPVFLALQPGRLSKVVLISEESAKATSDRVGLSHSDILKQAGLRVLLYGCLCMMQELQVLNDVAKFGNAFSRRRFRRTDRWKTKK